MVKKSIHDVYVRFWDTLNSDFHFLSVIQRSSSKMTYYVYSIISIIHLYLRNWSLFYDILWYIIDGELINFHHKFMPVILKFPITCYLLSLLAISWSRVEALCWLPTPPLLPTLATNNHPRGRPQPDWDRTGRNAQASAPLRSCCFIE